MSLQFSFYLGKKKEKNNNPCEGSGKKKGSDVP